MDLIGRAYSCKTASSSSPCTLRHATVPLKARQQPQPRLTSSNIACSSAAGSLHEVDQRASSSAIQFRPCIDIHKGKVKQIVGSTLSDLGQSSGAAALVTNFESDKPSAWFADLYRGDGLTGGHIIMLGADADSRAAAQQALEAYPGGMQLGGGVTADNAAQWLEWGASHVIVTSYVFCDGALQEDRLRGLVSLVGKQRLVLDLSCRQRDGKYYVVTDRWQKFSDLEVNRVTLQQLAGSCDEFLVHGVDVEGKQLGIDEQLVQLLGEQSPIPVTYAGGARTMDDLERVRSAGGGRVHITVGSALDIFGGQLPYPEVVEWHNRQQQAQA